MIRNITLFIFIGLSVLLFSSCEAWDRGEHPQLTAVKKIAEYADNNETKGPDAKLYKRAGVHIDSSDINATNDYIKTLHYTDVDTTEEIQDIVDNLGAYTNEKPTAKISVESSSVDVGELVLLDGIESTDSDGIITKYEWKIANKVVHTGIAYDARLAQGRHIVELVVTDDYNATDSDTISVVVRNPEDKDTTNDNDTKNIELPNAEIEVVENNTSITLKSVGRNEGRVSHTWKEDSKTLKTGDTYKVDLPKGKHTITLVVKNREGKTDEATTDIEVK